MPNFTFGCLPHEANGLLILKSPLLLDKNIKHGFTTRKGGISRGRRSGLNLSFSRYDDPSEPISNLKLLCEVEKLDIEDIALVNHEHGNTVFTVEASHRGRGISGEPLPPCDGLITRERGVTLMTLHSDCCGYLMYDPKTGSIGAAHAGWRGTKKRIGCSMIDAMRERFGAEPENILVSVLPSICGSCYEVDEALAESFVLEFKDERVMKPKNSGKAYLDIEYACALQLLDCGVLPENIRLMHRCTMEEEGLFYSYRRDGLDAGAMAAYITLS